MIDTDEPYNSSLEAAEDYQDQIDTLLAEVKRLREAIADIATNMEAADASLRIYGR
jgi:prefoldin subunit 5